MPLSEILNSPIPIFDWSWWSIFLFTTTVGWALGRIIKGLEPMGWEKPLKKGGRDIWWSGFYGDIFLPIGIASSIVVAQGVEPINAWYTSTLWNWILFFFGLLIILSLEIRSKYTYKQLTTPSKLWHTFVAFPMFFYLGAMSWIPFITVHTPMHLVLLGLIGYGGWIFTYIHDLKHPPDPTKTH